MLESWRGAARSVRVAGLMLAAGLLAAAPNRDEDLLNNGHRRAILRAVHDDPGIHLSGLKERTGVSWGSTVYHVRRLEEAGLVESRRQGRCRRVYPARGEEGLPEAALGALRSGAGRRFAETVASKAPVLQSHLVETLDVSRSRVSKLACRLEDAGLVERERQGRTKRVEPTERFWVAWELLEHGDGHHDPVEEYRERRQRVERLRGGRDNGSGPRDGGAREPPG